MIVSKNRNHGRIFSGEVDGESVKALSSWEERTIYKSQLPIIYCIWKYFVGLHSWCWCPSFLSLKCLGTAYHSLQCKLERGGATHSGILQCDIPHITSILPPLPLAFLTTIAPVKQPAGTRGLGSHMKNGLSGELVVCATCKTLPQQDSMPSGAGEEKIGKEKRSCCSSLCCATTKFADWGHLFAHNYVCDQDC